MSHVLPKATWSKLLNKETLDIIWSFWELAENHLWVLWMFSGRSLQVPVWVNEQRNTGRGVRTSGFLGPVAKHICNLGWLTEVLSFLICSVNEFASSSTNCFPGSFSTMKEFYSLLNGRNHVSDVWVFKEVLILLTFTLSEKGVLPSILLLFSLPTNTITPFLPSKFSGRPYPGFGAWRYSAIKVGNGSVYSCFIPPASKGVKLYSVLLLLGRKHARSGCGSVSKGRPRDSVPSSALQPASYQLQPFR